MVENQGYDSDESFEFEVGGGGTSFFDDLDSSKPTSKPKLNEKIKSAANVEQLGTTKQTTINQKIAKAKKKNKLQGNNETEKPNLKQRKAEKLKAKSKAKGDNNEEDPNEEPPKTFSELLLIKPLLKSCFEAGYENPTRIQELAIPLILDGRDVLASSVTGSGKTAAFLLPILQTYYNQSLSNRVNLNSSRVLVVIPTRELAVQCYEMLQTLNKYTKLSSALIIGASSIEKQVADLGRAPVIIITTPGRIVDHLQNTKGFDLDDIEILVLDEADKLLELGFMYELKEIVGALNSAHQTLLFSATLGGRVTELVDLALKNPIRIQANADFTMADRLTQEYVKMKPEADEKYREAVLLALAEQFKTKTIIFFKTKQECHRMAILFGLVGHEFRELHGSLNQGDRIDALIDFKEDRADFLLATDLAARGIDIKEVQTVINFELPTEVTKYIHRVGRTARAGESGLSITICDEKELKNLKSILKTNEEPVAKREVSFKKVEEYQVRIQGLEYKVNEILEKEKFERELKKAEMEATKAQNMIQHKDEIYHRPRKAWIVNEKQKKDLRKRQKESLTENEVFFEKDERKHSSARKYGHKVNKKVKK